VLAVQEGFHDDRVILIRHLRTKTFVVGRRRNESEMFAMKRARLRFMNGSHHG
jgi:hypothetical protein